MDANRKIQPVMNQRGYYVAMHTEGGEIPAELLEQCWTSEREATQGLNKFFSSLAQADVVESSKVVSTKAV